ncbi:hypothetical protein K5V07_01835 [Flavobacterium sp. CHNK8]|uniref:hypothetical protein n=1 Tax=Flavobacterium sp. CHNK8 TaxID=2871165 RepID=UPI001C8EAD00|nr:hypothetical protein [Flavobacterium sp. CHNK8]QZK89298.1 hypothetical protein K5V07_01835 [Flavobacterium sp. CHNK8]
MKKIFLVLIVFVSVGVNAKEWNVSTTCGVTGSINIADNASVEQIRDAVSMYNFNNCGVYPKKVTITIAN